MCGIAGIFTFNDSKVPLQNIRLMTRAMRHRGPDDEGMAFFKGTGEAVIYGDENTPTDVYKSDTLYTPQKPFSVAVPDGSFIAFGHTRLSILDLSAAGHQPMCTEDSRYWIVHNGEIYNFQEIREELKKKGEYFSSNTDTEVILKAYRLWGSDCLNRFNGMWAFAIWDDKGKVLFCSRDRIGIKPFYYYLTDDYFIFASDIKTLIASGLYQPEPDWEGIYHAMSFYCAPRPMTCFKGVSALEQAHWMRINPLKDIRKHRYWRMPVGEINYNRSENDWKEELEYTLHNAVKRRLVADVPVGVFMSGGVDSTTIAAIAAKEHPGIKAFTLAYENDVPEMNELPQARATAAMWPMTHIVKVMRLKNTIKHLSDMTRCYEDPFHGLSPNYMISKLVAKNDVKVVLNGLGGDELFCGYGREKIARIWRMVSPWHRIISHIPVQNGKLGKVKILSGLKDISECYLLGFSTFTEGEKKELFCHPDACNWNSFEKFRQLYELKDLPFADAIEAIGYFDIINYIGNHFVHRVDQFTMHFSLEGRFPFLDHELVELACRMPSNLKVKNGVGKYILKQVAKNLIHPSCISMKKKGFGLPVDHWMKNSLSGVVEIGLNEVKQTGIMNNVMIEKIKQEFMTSKAPYSKLCFLAFLGLWLREFGMGGRREF